MAAAAIYQHMEQVAADRNSQMEQQLLQDFLATGRTGRRNALPDILDEQKASVGTGSLAFDMNKLSCTDDKGNASSTQGASRGGGGEVEASNQGS